MKFLPFLPPSWKQKYKHALVIVNNGGASGEEIYKFSQNIKKSVLKKFNILLEEEVNIFE